MAYTQLFVDGRWTDGEGTFEVFDKFTGKLIAEVAEPSRRQVAEAVLSAAQAFETDPLSPRARSEFLLGTATIVGKMRSRLVETLVAETGFTIADANNEIDRCIDTLTLCGEEAKRIKGEMVPLGGARGGAGRLGFTLRVPLGVVCAITPFNSPLNTVAHKIGPALAAGNTVVLKPAAYTPLTAALLFEALLAAGTPPTHIALLQGRGGTVGSWLLEEQAIRFYTFTGSTAVGRLIQQKAGLRRTQMELGSIASTIVCNDADLERALPKIVSASFRKAGQVCTSIQRLYVEDAIAADFVERFVETTAAARYGDPRAKGTLTGPMIAVSEAARVEEWVEEAVCQGARVNLGGSRNGAVVRPTVLTATTPEMRVMREEIFGPVVCVLRFADLGQVIKEVNALPFGLAAGIFTRNLTHALGAAERLQYGSVHVNETSSSRVDLMPYGGTKDSGFGREGPRYAIEEMSETRMITITT